MTAALEGGEWSAARLGRTLPTGKAIVQEAGWTPGPVWTDGKSRPHRDSIPQRPARSSVAIPTELPAPPHTHTYIYIYIYIYIYEKLLYLVVSVEWLKLCHYYVSVD